jgi:hypothetical protein
MSPTQYPPRFTWWRTWCGILLWAHNKTNSFNSGLLAYKLNSLVMVVVVVATTEACRNIDWLCENCRIIKCILLENFRQICCICLSFSGISLFVNFTNWPFQTKPKSLWVSQSFRFCVNIFSRSALAGEVRKYFFLPRPKPDLSCPGS